MYSVLDDHDRFVLMDFFSMPSCWPSPLQFVKDFDRTNCSIKSEESTSTEELDDDQNNDGEGVWSPDIEQSFHVILSFVCIHLWKNSILLGGIGYLSCVRS